ncbi:hypothetical protein [uncultured Megasphaera sp.]|jgi:hypothetical protein|uniref:hypothetical protein n=1 Tax=uncultured Megasphaera sp. TaxID=165188 RepID=UPI0020674229|nr:hypothetical protein [uncultured Megasphaera sp.]DAM58428.1 MAG TPA: SECRETED 45 KDA PROTEIN CYCLE, PEPTIDOGLYCAN, CHAP, CELL [Caudoviricetes sp.]
MNILELISTACVLSGVLGVIFRYAVLNPLYMAIQALQDAVKELKVQIREMDGKRQELSVRIAKTESSVKSAHKRIDDLQKGLNHEG